MTATETGRRVVDVIKDEELTLLAAGVAYYTIASLLPLLVLLLAALSVFEAVDSFLALLRSLLPLSAMQGLRELLQRTRWHGLASGVGAAFLLWSGSKAFRGLSMAFATIYEADPDLTYLGVLLRSLLLLAVFLVAMVLLAVTGVVLAAVRFSVPHPALLGNALAALLLAPVLLPLYTILPPTSVDVRGALPGALVASVGLVLLQVLFSTYAQHAGSVAIYGYLGAGLLFVTLVYAACLVLVGGAVVNVARE